MVLNYIPVGCPWFVNFMLSFAVQAAMSTKHTLELSSLLDILFYVVAFWYMHYSQSYGESNILGWDVKKMEASLLNCVKTKLIAAACQLVVGERCCRDGFRQFSCFVCFSFLGYQQTTWWRSLGSQNYCQQFPGRKQARSYWYVTARKHVCGRTGWTGACAFVRVIFTRYVAWLFSGNTSERLWMRESTCQLSVKIKLLGR